MSKREGNPNMQENAPESKKQKVEDKPVDDAKKEDKPLEKQKRHNSPVAGPSSAPSDPQLQVSFQTGLIPICRYFDTKLLEESSSQGSTSATDAVATTSTTDTTSSTNVEVGDSRTGSVENMEVDTETTTSTSESSTSTQNRRRRHRRRYRTHKSRRDQ